MKTFGKLASTVIEVWRAVHSCKILEALPATNPCPPGCFSDIIPYATGMYIVNKNDWKELSLDVNQIHQSGPWPDTLNEPHISIHPHKAAKVVSSEGNVSSSDGSSKHWSRSTVFKRFTGLETHDFSPVLSTETFLFSRPPGVNESLVPLERTNGKEKARMRKKPVERCCLAKRGKRARMCASESQREGGKKEDPFCLSLHDTRGRRWKEGRWTRPTGGGERRGAWMKGWTSTRATGPGTCDREEATLR